MTNFIDHPHTNFTQAHTRRSLKKVPGKIYQTQRNAKGLGVSLRFTAVLDLQRASLHTGGALPEQAEATGNLY